MEARFQPPKTDTQKLAGLQDGQVLEIKPYSTPSHEQYRLVQWILQTVSESVGVGTEEIKNRAKMAGGYVDGPAIMVGEHLCQPLKSTSSMSKRELSRFIEDLIDFVSVEFGIDVSSLRREVAERAKMRRW